MILNTFNSVFLLNSLHKQRFTACFLVLMFSLFFYSCKKNEQSSMLNTQKASSDYELFYEKCTDTDGNVDLSCMIGAKMPLFKAKTMNGSLVSTESLMGRVVVLNFWAIHCKPCIAEIPGLNDLVDIYQKKDVVFLAIAGNTNEQLIPFFKEHPFDFDIIIDENYEIGKGIFKNNWGLPLTIVVNKNGELQKTILGGRTDQSAPEHIKSILIPEIDGAIIKN